MRLGVIPGVPTVAARFLTPILLKKTVVFFHRVFGCGNNEYIDKEIKRKNREYGYVYSGQYMVIC